jgi:ferredoxin
MQGVMCRACEAACETDAIRFRPRIALRRPTRGQT